MNPILELDSENPINIAYAGAGYEVMSGPRTMGDGYYESSVRAFEDIILEITE